MTPEEIGIQLNLIGRSETIAGLEDVQATLEGLGAQVETLSANLEALTAATEAETTASETAATALETNTAAVEANVAATEALVAANEATAASLDAVAAAGSGAAAGTTAAAGSAAGLGGAFAALKSPLAELGVAVGGVEIIRMGMQFDDNAVKVSNFGGITLDQAHQIGNAFSGMAGQAEYSANRILAAFAPVAGQLAIINGGPLSVGQSVQFMQQAQLLTEATSGAVPLNQSAGILSMVEQAYGMPVSATGSVADVLFNVQKATQVSADQMGNAIDKLHARLGVLTPSLTDISALTTSLAENGMNGGRSVLAMAAAFNKLLGDSKPVQDMLKILGISVYDINGNFVGFQDVLDQVRSKFATLSTQDQEIAAQTLFGLQGTMLGGVLSTGPRGFESALGQVSAPGSVSAAAAAQQGSPGGIEKRIVSSIENAMSQAGQNTLSNPLGAVAGGGIGAILGGIVGGPLGIAAGAALGSVLGGNLEKIIKSPAGQSVVQGISQSGIGQAVGGAATAAWSWLSTTGWADAKSAASDAWDFIQSKTKEAVTWLENFFAPFIKFWNDHWTEIKNAGVIVWTIIVAGWHFFLGEIEASWRITWAVVGGAIKLGWDTISTMFKVGRDIVMGILGPFLDILSGHWQKAWDDIQSSAKAVWHDLTDGMSSWASDLWDSVGKIFAGGVNGAIDIINGLIHVINDIGGHFGLHIDTISHVNFSGGGGSDKSTLPPLHRATGGIVTSGTTAIVGEGNYAWPEYVIPTDPAHRARALGLFAELGGSLMAGGGILGPVGSALGSAWDATGGKVVGAVEGLISSAGLAALHAALSPLRSGAYDAVSILQPELIRSLAMNVLDFLFGGSSSSTTTGGGGALTSASGNVALGQQMAAAYGWVGNEWDDLFKLWQQESGWDSGPGSVNKSSGAYGIPQANPSGGQGHPYALNDAQAQIAWGLQYVKGRYGDPVAAWGHEVAVGWYDQGGLLPPGVSLAVNSTGSAEVVAPDRAGAAQPLTVNVVLDRKVLAQAVIADIRDQNARR